MEVITGTNGFVSSGLPEEQWGEWGEWGELVLTCGSLTKQLDWIVLEGQAEKLRERTSYKHRSQQIEAWIGVFVELEVTVG